METEDTCYIQSARCCVMLCLAESTDSSSSPCPIKPPTDQWLFNVSAWVTMPNVNISNRSSSPTKRESKRRTKKRESSQRKVQKIVEDGNDDCGDDITGLGPEVTLLAQDVVQEDISEDSEIQRSSRHILRSLSDNRHRGV